MTTQLIATSANLLLNITLLAILLFQARLSRKIITNQKALNQAVSFLHARVAVLESIHENHIPQPAEHPSMH